MESEIHVLRRLVFGEEKPLFEVHIFDFKKNIYGEDVSVEVKDFIRRTQAFASLPLLVKQMHKDCDQAKKILA